jgi:uncharacterized phage-associated protein
MICSHDKSVSESGAICGGVFGDINVSLRGEDARSVVNEILLEHQNARITNLSAQKIVYFLHGQYLLSTQNPLVSGYFEAWEFGPVHPTLYGALKYLGSDPLTQPIMRRDIQTGAWIDIPRVADKNVRNFVREASSPLLRLSAGQLVDLSHAPNSPWDVVSRYGHRRTWGLRLDNELISRHFRFHKRSVSDLARGDGFEEHPPSGD